MSRRLKYYFFIIAVLFVGTAFLSSCEKTRKEPFSELQIKDMPALSARNFETIYTDSGKVTMVMRSPLVMQYTGEDDPHTEFPEGLVMLFYDKTTVPQASLASHYARYKEKEELWELRDSVVVISEKGEILETELLYWDEQKELVWSDRFVKITAKDKIIMGTGFESDPRLTHWTIKNVSATIYIKDEQKGNTGN
ncbi:MAG TPA: LPS export ABC transporter periplasmic protein LptC [Bacteroidales bacterium]|nr:LPS export ABC transporter periplasmic protein LptC [Bacteroidales bacterium]